MIFINFNSGPHKIVLAISKKWNELNIDCRMAYINIQDSISITLNNKVGIMTLLQLYTNLFSTRITTFICFVPLLFIYICFYFVATNFVLNEGLRKNHGSNYSPKKFC